MIIQFSFSFFIVKTKLTIVIEKHEIKQKIEKKFFEKMNYELNHCRRFYFFKNVEYFQMIRSRTK